MYEISNVNGMSSLEIAEIVEKRHDQILRDIRDEVEKLEKQGIRAEHIFVLGEYKDKNNQKRPMYVLTREGVLQLAARYSAVVRFRLIEKVTNNGVPQNFAQALYLAAQQQEKIQNLQLENKMKDHQIAELMAKATYYDLILQNSSVYSVTQIAKDYGMSATALNKLLHEMGIQFNQSGVWLLYQKYAAFGYTSSKTQNYNRSDGSQGSRIHTYWTQKGRLFLYDLLKKNGYIPLIEREWSEMKNTLTVKECAEFIGKSMQSVRIGLQRGNFKFGTAIQTKEPTPTKPRGAWDYHIPRVQVEKYMGVSYKKFLKESGQIEWFYDSSICINIHNFS